jgi:hypothetical protein
MLVTFTRLSPFITHYVSRWGHLSDGRGLQVYSVVAGFWCPGWVHLVMLLYELLCLLFDEHCLRLCHHLWMLFVPRVYTVVSV